MLMNVKGIMSSKNPKQSHLLLTPSGLTWLLVYWLTAKSELAATLPSASLTKWGGGMSGNPYN